MLLLQDDTRLVTASGDKTVAMFDTIVSARVAVFRGHRGSVKSIRPWAACPGVLASGARDGCVQVQRFRNSCQERPCQEIEPFRLLASGALDGCRQAHSCVHGMKFHWLGQKCLPA